MARKLKAVTQSRVFTRFILAVIVLAGVVVGLQTYRGLVESHGPLLKILDATILWIFVVEAALKILSEGSKPWNYFRDSWNVFDFTIVAICFLPFGVGFLAVLRLARILRVFRLVTALPRLQMIVGTLLKTLPSMGYIFLLLCLHFYIYAAMATFIYAENDPYHFDNLQLSMLTLFRVVTMEDWTDVMYIQMYGSDNYGYSAKMDAHLEQLGLSRKSSASPVGGALFFVSFVITGAFIILNLFIGVILAGMDEVRAERAEAASAKSDKAIHEEVSEITRELDDAKKRLLALAGRLEKQTEG